MHIKINIRHIKINISSAKLTIPLDHDHLGQVFKAYLAWCETQRDCNRLRLVDILVRPMQRLTKYSLLLKAVLKKTDDVNQKKDLAEMVRHFRRQRIYLLTGSDEG